jgi:hypothetical protein
MGTDIHIFVETRLYKKDPWKIYHKHIYSNGELNEVAASDRWHMFFHNLSSHHSYGCGLPSDCDQRIKEAYNKTYYWGGTCVSLDVFKHILLKTHKNSLIAFNDEARGDPYLGYPHLSYFDERPTYSDLVNYFSRWRFSKLLDNHMYDTKYQPEIRFIFFFDN